MKSMSQIEFLYFEECPGYKAALALLKEVLVEENRDVPITFIQVETEAEARQHNFYGSPSIRINGTDIAPLPEDMADPNLACRAYIQADGRISPLPPRELIVAAVKQL